MYIYQNTGVYEGIYVNDDDKLFEIVKKISFSISTKDFDEIKRLLSLQAPHQKINNNKDLIAVNNGIFNYSTKELKPFTPDIAFTTKSRVDYNPNAINPVIHNNDDNTDWDVESWMQELSDDPEIVSLLWQVVGSVIRPHVEWNKAICLFDSKGNNGKGTLCQLMRNLCGEDNHVSLSFSDLTKEFMLEPLTSVSAIITDENSTREFVKEVSALKTIITGDILTINRKFKSPITIQFNGVIIQCLNDLPRFNDKSNSLYRRFIFIPFDKSFTGIEKKYIKTNYIKRKDVLEYVLFKVLNSDYYDYSIPKACGKLLNEYKAFNDPVKEFLDEILDEITWDFIPKAFLYDLYKAWAEKYCPSGKMLGKKTFNSDVVNILTEEDYGWDIDDVPKKRDNLMNKPELLIAEYGLNNWKNPVYKGNDENKICMPELKSRYTGYRRT